MVAAQWIAGCLEAYAAVGLVFALAFSWVGVERVDANARGTGIGFRLLILPGAAVLWPFLLLRWWRAPR